MIHMPRRSVTRFFIPLIDVLLLLFCIFLLMPMVAEEATQVEDEKRKTAHELLARRIKELEKEVEKRDAIIKSKGVEDVAELRKELDRLRKLASASVQERLFMRVLDINPDTGVVSYYDATRTGKDKTFPITDKKSADYLIEKHKRQAGARDLYYFFHAPGDTGYPTIAQKEQLRAWFKAGGVAHSLAE